MTIFIYFFESLLKCVNNKVISHIKGTKKISFHYWLIQFYFTLINSLTDALETSLLNIGEAEVDRSRLDAAPKFKKGRQFKR